MKCYYSIIPPFHYSWLEEKEWLAGNPLLSTICRSSDIFNYKWNLRPSGRKFDRLRQKS
jgi:hypothetical protein